MNELDSIIEALNSLRIPPMPEEYDIHEAIADVLGSAGLDFIHEYRLAPGRRIDFICGRTGIEVKKGRPVSSRVRQQIGRYLSSDELDALIVVMQKPCYLPDCVGGKPVRIVALNRLWGVALP